MPARVALKDNTPAKTGGRRLFEKGKAREQGAGRPKGTPNKTTRLLREAIILAAEEVGNPTNRGQGGLVGYLQWLAKKRPELYAVLLGKVLPLQVVGEGGGPVQVKLTADQAVQVLKERGLPIPGIFDSPNGAVAEVLLPPGSKQPTNGRAGNGHAGTA